MEAFVLGALRARRNDRKLSRLAAARVNQQRNSNEI